MTTPKAKLAGLALIAALCAGAQACILSAKSQRTPGRITGDCRNGMAA